MRSRKGIKIWRTDELYLDCAFYTSGVGAFEALSGKIRQYDILNAEVHISFRYSSLP